MTEAIDTRIIEALRAKPGQTAAELARALGLDRTTINQRLYGALKGCVEQDSSYRWRLAEGGREAAPSGTSEPTPFANTDLARLARYYLACIGFDDAGVSTFLTSRYGDLDYAEIATLPRTADALADSAATRQLLGRKRTDRGRYRLYLGYPTAITAIRSRRTGWEGMMVEPLLLMPLEPDPASGRLMLDLGSLLINQKPLRAYTNAEPDAIMHELVELEHDLGLGWEGEAPELDEVAMRLQAVRPEWPWREPITPEALSAAQGPISEITSPGIFNRAILILAEKSPFTQGLEQELRELGRLPESTYRDTALGRWLRGEENPEAPSGAPAALPLLEVLPMNSEQREAVTAALTRPLTVITGPPGTGKSQVVTNLLINAAWMGKRVLFASKNNKAVDVVETRINALGPRPILLRVGSGAYQTRLAEYVLALLSATSTPSEREEFEETRQIHERLLRQFQSLEEEARKLVELRNRVDHLEQQIEDARERLPAEIFARAAEFDAPAIEQAVSRLEAAADQADRAKASFLGRLFWPFLRAQRLQLLAEASREAAPALRGLLILLPGSLPDETLVRLVREAAVASRDRLRDVKAVAQYRQALRSLQEARTLEDLAGEQARLQERIAKNSLQLWRLWLRIQPSRLPAEKRQSLGRYSAVLKMVVEAGANGELPGTVRTEYRRLLRELAPILPCWAVTSLSARGRIAFEPGQFDIVIFDEASQCDIASALPLLYRAKAAVVIGDAKQLSHISGLPRGQDQALLEKHGLFPDFAEWAYSHQSLFTLASGKVAAGDVIALVDHHRSHADIIGFSNDEFYERRLRVATRYDRLKTPGKGEPGVRWIDVKGQVVRPASGGAVNPTEVLAVVEALRDLLVRRGYAGTVGLVTPFRAQANAVTEAVNRDDGFSAALMRAEFLADTVHKFQGDERDVMVFSPVVASGMPDGALEFLRRHPNLFNVAITRARAQLIVVGDRAACMRSDIGYLSRFARYTATLGVMDDDDIATRLEALGPEYPPVARPELVSEWEKVFYRALFAAGIRPIPQYPVEKYVLDFLVVAGDRRLAIEVDGERYHRNWTSELCRRDQIRNQRLIELGYDVRRFWVYEIRDELDRCVSWVQDWIRQGS